MCGDQGAMPSGARSVTARDMQGVQRAAAKGQGRWVVARIPLPVPGDETQGNSRFLESSGFLGGSLGSGRGQKRGVSWYKSNQHVCVE